MIKYLIGDATQPQGQGKKIIVHICNNVGAWGAGFVLAVSKRWKTPELYYRAMSKEDRILGSIRIVQVEDDIWVANMIAQHDVKPMHVGTFGTFGTSGAHKMGEPQTIPPIRYEALQECLRQVNEYAVANNATVHMPRIGAGLAGGNWTIIEALIEKSIVVDTFVYDLPTKS